MIGVVLCTVIIPRIPDKLSNLFDLINPQIWETIIVLGILIIPLFAFAIFYFIRRDIEDNEDDFTDFL